MLAVFKMELADITHGENRRNPYILAFHGIVEAFVLILKQ
jgi:hypothetical protein